MVQGTPNPGALLQARSQRYDRLTPADCARLHAASLSILERTGVRIHDDEAVERLRGAGAIVGDDGRVRVPGHLVAWALDTAPKTVTLHDRSGAPAMTLAGDNVYFVLSVLSPSMSAATTWPLRGSGPCSRTSSTA